MSRSRVCALVRVCAPVCVSVGVWNFNLLSDPTVRPVGSGGGCGLSGEKDDASQLSSTPNTFVSVGACFHMHTLKA